MRILVLHSRYRSGDLSGENRVVADEVALLRSAGHEVGVWQPTTPAGRGSGPVAGARAVHSPTAVGVVRRAVRRRRIDVVHCHNLFPMLSPGVLRVAADEGAAVVVTLHNYRLACLPATLLRDGRVCEDCIGRIPWRGVLHRCYRGSVGASAALASSLTAHRALGTFGKAHLLLAPSAFLRQTLVAAGLPDDQVLVKRNFVPDAPRREGPGGYFLFLGRLSQEKGAETILRAFRRRHGRLLIAGDGPERARLADAAPPGVELLGSVPADHVPSLLAGARALLMPSRSYEGAPRALLEAYAASVPVVAARLGALPELVLHEETGLLADESPDAWSSAMDRLLNDALSVRMGTAARTLWRSRFDPAHALVDLEAAYDLALFRAATFRNRPVAAKTP